MYFNVEVGSWHLMELSVEELAALMSRYWVEYVWEWRLSRRLAFQDLVDLDFSHEDTGSTGSILCALYNHLAGRREKSLGYIMKLIRLGEMTIAELREEFEASPPPALLKYSEDDPERETRLIDICKKHKRWREKEAMRARRLAAAIDFEV